MTDADVETQDPAGGVLDGVVNALHVVHLSKMLIPVFVT